MIPAQRKPEHDAPAPTDRVVYSATVTQPGCTQAGDGFRTHRATVGAQPKGSS